LPGSTHPWRRARRPADPAFEGARPVYPGGKQGRAVTCHLDIAPTLVGLTGVAPDKTASIGNWLPGKDRCVVLAAPEKSEVNAVRGGASFDCTMFAHPDGNFLVEAVE
jgi:phosphoglycerol transferase MdoB-like AlkP superfamily enzyme